MRADQVAQRLLQIAVRGWLVGRDEGCIGIGVTDREIDVWRFLRAAVRAIAKGLFHRYP